MFIVQFCETKLSGVELLLSLAKLVSPDIVLDRIIPYLVSDDLLCTKTKVFHL